MTQKLFILGIIIFGCMALFMGDSPTPNVQVIYPAGDDTTSYDQGKIILVSAVAQAVPNLLVSTQWETEEMLPIGDRDQKANFPKEFYNLFAPATTLQSLIYSLKYFKGYSKPETLTYAYTDTVSIKSLWAKPEFTKLVKATQSNETDQIIIYIRGWQDSVYSPVYEDPNSDGHTLYKLHVQLIPENNTIYFAPSGQKKSAINYTTQYINDSKPTSERTNLFHNSTLEQSCTTCHEGLPSADSGKTMTADCAVCHKERFASTVVHPPVANKECTTCHSWSVEKHAVVVESGVPQTCFTCHSDIETKVDSSAVQHPVASECLTCHSPHGTVNKHILKKNVYSLCSGCHDTETMNHPVGRHPVRFATIPNSNEEISCISCHTPHGSPNQSLLKFPGGTMEVCSQCH
jgi:predicted CXXCH cytochrome family protein